MSEGQNNSNNVLPDHRTLGLKVSEDVSMREVETLPVTEDDGNVEKAEGYTKQLEDVSKPWMGYNCYFLFLLNENIYRNPFLPSCQDLTTTSINKF